MAAQSLGRLTQGQDLGVAGGVFVGFGTVVAAADDGAVFDHDGSDGDLTQGQGFAGLCQGFFHPGFSIGLELKLVGHESPPFLSNENCILALLYYHILQGFSMQFYTII